MRRSAALLWTGVVAGVSACSGGSGASSDAAPYTIVVAAPLTTQPWVGESVERGARLAADEINAGDGIGDDGRPVRLVVLDAGTPREAVAAARRAVDLDAAAFITDGTGAVAAADVAAPADLPVFVVFDGGGSIVDPDRRPNVFRIAPANRIMGVRLADYLAQRHPHVAIISDDTSYGRDGAAALRAGFERDHIPVVADKVVPPDASSVDPQVLDARRSGADLVAVWGSAPVVAATIRSARSAGWDVPVVAGPTGEDPLVRQQLADHRDWVDGLTFVSFRITAELGPKPYEKFRAAYENRWGEEKVGVEQAGTPVVQPPDFAMFPYDTVRLVAAALDTAGAVGAPLMTALDNTVITGANGDERGFIPGVREGVSPDDMYFARFGGFRFVPVTDDILSEGLPRVPQ